MYGINWSAGDAKKIRYKDAGKMVRRGGGKIENRSRFTDTCTRSLEVEAENGRMRGRHGRRGSRVKGKGREGERAGPPNEPPEKRRRWEYWSGMPATGCLERSPLPSLLYQYHPLSSFLPSMHTNALPSLFRPSLFVLLAPVFFLYSKRSSSPSTPIPETLTKPRITRLPLASSSISDLRSSVLWFHATSSSISPFFFALREY